MVWAVARATRQSPSELLGIREWAADLTGMPDDLWTPLQFDAAVSYFGNYVEGKLNEVDPKTGQHLHTLDDLLADPKQRVSKKAFIKSVLGLTGVSIRKGKRGG
jgi:hypothetical protein